MGWKEVYEGGADDDLEDEADDEKKLKDQRLPEMKTGTQTKDFENFLKYRKNKTASKIHRGNSSCSYGKSGGIYGDKR